MSDFTDKVLNGTRSDATDLCPSCSRSVIVKGGRDSDETRYCHVTQNYVKNRVAECSGYYNSDLPSIQTLYDVAWILSTDKKQNAIGFVSPQDWKKKNPDSHWSD